MRVLMVVLLIFSLMFTAGCAGQGADDQTVEGLPTPTEAAEESHAPETVTFTDTTFTVEMELDDFYFDPGTIKAPGGSTATVQLTNDGDIAHTFTIEALDVDEQIDAGSSKKVTVELGAETRYEYVCSFHAESNDMRGSFSLH